MITKFLKTLIRGLPNHTEEDFAQICEETSKNQKIHLKEINEEEKKKNSVVCITFTKLTI